MIFASVQVADHHTRRGNRDYRLAGIGKPQLAELSSFPTPSIFARSKALSRQIKDSPPGIPCSYAQFLRRIFVPPRVK
jgi:hypothetical protein